MRTQYSPAVSEFYEPGYALTGHLISHTNYPEYSVDPPRCSWDGFLSTHYVSRQQEPFSSNDLFELRNARSTPRRHSASTLDSPIAVGSSSTEHRSTYDSPQLSPHMPIRCMYDSPQVSPHMPIAHPLPTPPSSPSKSGRKILPKKLPLPPPTRPAERDFETSQRSQRTNPWKTHPSCQSSVSPQQCPKNWSKGKVLGKGSFGTVYEALNLDDGSFFAVKISEAETAAPELRQEIDMLKRLNHPNIVRYLGSSLDDGHLCIFLELVGMGSLRRVLDKYNHFEENMIRTYTRQILWGLEYLHQQNTIHRDLKCANILVDPYGQVKLADFGVAKQMSESLANSCKGTPLYMAPEMMKASMENRKYGLAVDIWSLGCTIIEMADGKAPWSDLEGFSFFFKLNRGELPPIPDHLSLEAKDFLGRCLKVKPQERANVSELLQHPFVANAPAVALPLSPHMNLQRQYL
uniref:mitogen-activated protein kinase kinase kinase n=1 Tax=Araucaria cunninghamii TaxID=56994 RepID=A0A0D6QZ31_ARACU